MFSIEADSKKIIELKAKEIALRFKWMAFVSAGFGALPIPGVSAPIDLGIFAYETIFQRKQLGIDDTTIKQRALKVGSTKEKVLHMLTERFREVKEDENSSLRREVLKVLSTGSAAQSVSMAVGIGAQVAVMDVASTATSLALPVVGSVISGAISCGKTYYILKQMLKVNCEISLNLMKVFSQISFDMER